MGNTTRLKKTKTNNPSESSNCLRIFLSHKLGKSRDKAKRVAAALSILANDKMSVKYSADFERGEEWEPKIRKELDVSDWLLLLYDGPDVNHDWVLWEAGYFRSTMTADPKRRLICLHDPRHSLPGPLRGFTSVPANEGEVYNLFKQIYLDEPWKIRPDLFADLKQEEIKDKVGRITKELSHEDEIVAQFTLSPTFTFHVKTEFLGTLANGSIPLDTQVSGDGPWEVAFGKPDKTIAWTWKQLVDGMEDWEPWAHHLAGMMTDALKFHSVPHPSMALRIKLNDSSESIYRVILRRLEKTTEECRFTFAAAKIITAYQPNNHVVGTCIYHLYNMAWFFRRQFLEKHMQTLRSLTIRAPAKERIAQSIRSINDDMKALHAEAQVRGVEDPARLIQAFQEPLRTEVKTALLETWPQLDSRLQTACTQDPPSATSIMEAISSMDEINRFFLNTCLKELLRLGPGDI